MLIFWSVLALVLLVIDALTSVYFLIGFGISALMTMAFSNFVQIPIQISIFLIGGTLISLYIVPKLKKIPKTKTFTDELVGTTFILQENVNKHCETQLKVKGVFWKVISEEDLKIGEKAFVKSIDIKNNTLKIKGE